MRILQSLAQKRPLAELDPVKNPDLRPPASRRVRNRFPLLLSYSTSNVLRHHTFPINCSAQSYKQVVIFITFSFTVPMFLPAIVRQGCYDCT